MALIAQETIQEIIEKVDIVDWIEQYVSLKRAGSDFKGLCPFHTEKTPSFHVTPSKQSFYCFGCQEGGTVISFVMKYENLSFPEAARRVAEKAGVVIAEEEYDPKQDAYRRRRGELLKLQKSAAEFFHYLLTKVPYAQPARDYLKGRKIGIDLAKEWMLGYAPQNQKIFFEWAAKNGFSMEQLVEGGLAAWRDENFTARGAYARFRHRLMFPVMNEDSAVIAFSGRVLEKDQKGGKYVNSPETPIFNKSRVFFGYHKAKRPITKANHAIICEGQIDMISAFHAGIENIVAPLGTAVTEEHAKVLRRQADEITLCFDSDNAGIAAAGKAFRTLAPKGLLIRLAFLPEGHDPDSFIRAQGVDAFREIIRSAPEYFDFHIDNKGNSIRSGSLREKIGFAQEIATDIALVDNKMLQDSLINRIAIKLGLGEEDIRKQVSGVAKVQQRTERNRKVREARDQERSRGKEPPLVIENRSVRLLCRLLLGDAGTKKTYHGSEVPAFFRDIPETELLTKVWRGEFDPDHPASVHAFIATLPDREQGAIHRIMKEPFPGATADWARECLNSLKKQGLQNKIKMIKTQLGNPDLPVADANSLTKELLDLQTQRNDIA